MTRQNRVDPSGRLIANPSKMATLMGNRGCLHDENGAIVRERAPTKRWIACTLEPKFGIRPLMQPGHYTELFFLDEFTALAAGHRPCAQCRPDEFRLFAAAWLSAGLSEVALAKTIDDVLDSERKSGGKTLISPDSVADGTIVRQPGNGTFHLVYGGRLYPWSFSGYGTPTQLTAATEQFELITPPSSVKVLEAGYRPECHSSLCSTSND